MNHEDDTPIHAHDHLLKFWATSPAFARVGLASRALWLLMAMHQHTPTPTPMSMPEIGALGGLDRQETWKLVAELMVAHLVEMHGHVILNPCFTVLPRPGISPAADQPTATPAGEASPPYFH